MKSVVATACDTSAASSRTGASPAARKSELQTSTGSKGAGVSRTPWLTERGGSRGSTAACVLLLRHGPSPGPVRAIGVAAASCMNCPFPPAKVTTSRVLSRHRRSGQQPGPTRHCPRRRAGRVARPPPEAVVGAIIDTVEAPLALQHPEHRLRQAGITLPLTNGQRQQLLRLPRTRMRTTHSDRGRARRGSDARSARMTAGLI